MICVFLNTVSAISDVTVHLDTFVSFSIVSAISNVAVNLDTSVFLYNVCHLQCSRKCGCFCILFYFVFLFCIFCIVSKN